MAKLSEAYWLTAISKWRSNLEKTLKYKINALRSWNWHSSYLGVAVVVGRRHGAIMHLETSQYVKALDMAKRAGRVGSGQSGHWSKQVIFKRVKRVAGWVGLRVGSSWPVFFNFFFFFFEVDAIYQLFMSSLTIIRFSLVILLPITTKYLTWYSNLVQLLFQLSRN